MFSVFNFSSIFPGGGQLTPFAPMYGRPWLPGHPVVAPRGVDVHALMVSGILRRRDDRSVDRSAFVFVTFTPDAATHDIATLLKHRAASDVNDS